MSVVEREAIPRITNEPVEIVRSDQGIWFARLKIAKSIVIDADYLAQFGLPPDYDFRAKLGPSVLHEATVDESKTAAEKLANALVKRTGQTPDIIIVSASHLPLIDPDNPGKQYRANQVRTGLGELVLKTPLAPATPDNTQTVSAACSGFVVALDWLRRINPQGKNVLMVMDETGYRDTLPLPKDDKGKSRLLFSDSGIAMQGDYGKDFTVEASTVQYEPDTGNLLRMRTPDYPGDEYLTTYRPPYGEYFKMDGPALRRHFGRDISKERLRELFGPEFNIELVDFVLHHQASIRMVDGFGTLGIENARFYGRGILEYGNTSSASIPFDLQDGLKEGQIKPGDLGLMIGYGAGLTWAAAVVRL